MGDSQAGGISKLLQAETLAQEIVNRARKAKTARLRQAQEEAAAEVAAYKAQREEAYKKLVAGHAGDAGSVQKQMEEEGATSINAVNAAVAAKKAEVVDLLVGYATKVNA